MEEILNSIINGQRKQALEQLKESDYTLVDLIEEINRELDDLHEATTIINIAFSTGYITSEFE